MQAITAGQYYLVFNSLSFTIATFAAATLFFWFGRSQCSPNYRTAVTITGLVTFIALYHYWRMFESWNGAFTVLNGTVELTGITYNRAYRYVDWLLTVPLLLIGNCSPPCFRGVRLSARRAILTNDGGADSSCG